MSKVGDRVLEVPKLDASGKPWPLWKKRLEVSLTARGLIGYLYGTKKAPVNPADGKAVAWIPVKPEELQAVEDYEIALGKWVEEDAIVQQQIAVTIPDSIFIDLMSKQTAHEYFEVLCKKFGNRSLVIGVETRRQLGELKLKEGADARAHFEKVKLLREELASVGHPISDTDHHLGKHAMAKPPDVKCRTH